MGTRPSTTGTTGSKGHVVIEPDTGLFPAATLTEAAGTDNHNAVVGLDLLAQDPG